MEGGITAILHAVLLVFLIIELGLTAYRTLLPLLLLFLSTVSLVQIPTNLLSSRYHRLRLLPRRDRQLPALQLHLVHSRPPLPRHCPPRLRPPLPLHRWPWPLRSHFTFLVCRFYCARRQHWHPLPRQLLLPCRPGCCRFRLLHLGSVHCSDRFRWSGSSWWCWLQVLPVRKFIARCERRQHHCQRLVMVGMN